MIRITNMYFYYNKMFSIIQVERRIKMIIGVCGKSGSGKSTLAEYLKKHYGENTIHVDVDKIGHKATEDNAVRDGLVSEFGEEILTDNKVDRKKLRKIVFARKEDMDTLTKYTWEYMREEIKRILEQSEGKIIILDWLLLPITEFFEACDMTILLDVPYSTRIKRVLKRDGITEEEFALRDSAAPEYDKTRFQVVLENTDENTLRKLGKIL